MYIFSMENPFFRFVGRVVDLVYLNLLTLICGLPVFTAGAAFTAMYRVLIKIAVNEEETITRVFFREFKHNFKKATVIWIPASLVLFILFVNAYLIRQGVLTGFEDLFMPIGVSIAVIAAIIVIFLHYYFSLLSRYDAGIKQTAMNALKLMIAFFPRSFCILMITICPFVFMTLSNYFLILWPLYGYSIPAFFIAMLIGKIFLKLEDQGLAVKPEKKEEENEETTGQEG